MALNLTGEKEVRLTIKTVNGALNLNETVILQTASDEQLYKLGIAVSQIHDDGVATGIQKIVETVVA